MIWFRHQLQPWYWYLCLSDIATTPMPAPFTFLWTSLIYLIHNLPCHILVYIYIFIQGTEHERVRACSYSFSARFRCFTLFLSLRKVPQTNQKNRRKKTVRSTAKERRKKSCETLAWQTKLYLLYKYRNFFCATCSVFFSTISLRYIVCIYRIYINIYILYIHTHTMRRILIFFLLSMRNEGKSWGNEMKRSS